MGERDDPADRLAEMRRTLRTFQKQQRMARLAKGLGKPRTRAEFEVWSKGVRERHGIGGDDDQE